MSRTKWQTWDDAFIAYRRKWPIDIAAAKAFEWEMRQKSTLEHTSTPDCWCEPELDDVDPDSGNEVWVHRERH